MTTERLSTESGLEEWVLYLSNGNVFTCARDAGQDDHFGAGWIVNNPYITIVKAYAPRAARDEPVKMPDVEIGYCERRLTALERLKIRRYVAAYWEIPF